MFGTPPPGSLLRLVNLITLALFYVTFTGFNNNFIIHPLFRLPVSYRIVVKVLLLVFKSLNNHSPSYLVDRFSYQSHSRNLRSASKQLLEQRRSFAKTYGDRAFQCVLLLPLLLLLLLLLLLVLIG